MIGSNNRRYPVIYLSPLISYLFMQYRRMAIEREAPEQLGYNRIKYNLSESSYTDQLLDTTNLNLHKLVLCYI